MMGIYVSFLLYTMVRNTTTAPRQIPHDFGAPQEQTKKINIKRGIGAIALTVVPVSLAPLATGNFKIFHTF